MKKQDMLKDNFINMKIEYQVNHHKTSRAIDTVFSDELKHFKSLLINFNNEYNCIDNTQIDLIVNGSNGLKDIFNSCKVILIEDYESRFNNHMEELSKTMYDFFIRKLNNDNIKSSSKHINKHLVELCKFDFFLIQDKLENKLIEFGNDFVYRYVNSEDARRDFDDIIRKINYTLVCNLKKTMKDSIDDKQDIAARYNTLNKKVILSNELVR